MAFNPTDAAVSSLKIRPWENSITMRRPTPISALQNCILAKSVWNAPAPAPRPWPCGRPCGCFPLQPNGQFAQGLANGRRAALALYEKIRSDQRFLTVFPPELDIVIWAPRLEKASEISARSKEIFETAARKNLHLAVAAFPKTMLEDTWNVEWDQEQVACLRSCLMKAEHIDWVDRIWDILGEIA
jgi:hypothetical protein